MDLSRLMQLFSSPETVESLQLSDKIYASLITTILGMGITFSALVILLFVISFMRKLAVKPEPAERVTTTAALQQEEDENELVAVITAAIVATMPRHRRNITIRNIKRVNDFQPQWNRAGIRNQVNNSLNL